MSTVTLGGSASGITVGKTAHGLMLMTWTPNPVPDEQCFEAIRAGVDALPDGTKMILNSAEFYGLAPPEANLELLARFYERYPEYVDKTFLSVKGGVNLEKAEIDLSQENLRRSVDNINAKLRGTKRMDVFEPARFNQSKYSIEETMNNVVQLMKEGKFDHIGVSECSADSLRRACSVHPVVIAEIEVSLWSYEEETKKVIAACAENNVAVLAYSPLGRGFLTGQISKASDLSDGDLRARLSRFTEDNIRHNMAIVDAIKAIAAKKNITPAQLALAWVSSLGPHVIPLPGSSKKTRTLENVKGGCDVQLTKEELREIDEVLKENTVSGSRYVDGLDDVMHLWG